MKKRFSNVLLNSAFLFCAVSSTAAQAQDLYGFLLVKQDGYAISNDITTDPQFGLLDTFGNVFSKNLDTKRNGYIKFKLTSLQPAASVECSSGTPGKTRCDRDEMSSFPWEKTTCLSDKSMNRNAPPCSMYLNAEKYFITVGDMRKDYVDLKFNKSAFFKSLNIALMAAGLDSPFGQGVGSVWWDKRVAELKDAISKNHINEEVTNSAIINKIKATEEDGFGKFNGLIPYKQFSYKRKLESLPTLLGSLQEYQAEQDKARKVFEDETLTTFNQYFLPKQAEAERTYPSLLAQQKATQLVQEKAEKAAQAERARIASNEVKRIATFRKNLKIETETNCGPVLTIKVNLIQVYSPVAGYGNEPWIRRDELYPSGYSCKFVNGNYVGTGAVN